MLIFNEAVANSVYGEASKGHFVDPIILFDEKTGEPSGNYFLNERVLSDPLYINKTLILSSLSIKKDVKLEERLISWINTDGLKFTKTLSGQILVSSEQVYDDFKPKMISVNNSVVEGK